MNTTCSGPLVVPYLDSNTTEIICISARDHFAAIYGTVQYGGISLFSFFALINLAYVIKSTKEVKKWTTLKMINLQLLLGALVHVTWLSIDMLSFKKILPVFVERVFRDIPCWIIVSVVLHYLTIWNKANAGGLMKSTFLTHPNIYFFQGFFVSINIVNRAVQQYYNDPALFSLFEAIFTTILGCGTLSLFIVCTMLLIQLRNLVRTTLESKTGGTENKILTFYGAMIKFYFLLAPGFLLFTAVNFGIVASKVIWLPVVIAVSHLWSVLAHIVAWVGMNFILWFFSFKTKAPSSSSTASSPSSTGTSMNVDTLTNKDLQGTRSEQETDSDK